jgi:hypothetical protein
MYIDSENGSKGETIQTSPIGHAKNRHPPSPYLPYTCMTQSLLWWHLGQTSLRLSYGLSSAPSTNSSWWLKGNYGRGGSYSSGPNVPGQVMVGSGRDAPPSLLLHPLPPGAAIVLLVLLYLVGRGQFIDKVAMVSSGKGQISRSFINDLRVPCIWVMEESCPPAKLCPVVSWTSHICLQSLCSKKAISEKAISKKAMLRKTRAWSSHIFLKSL